MPYLRILVSCATALVLCSVALALIYGLASRFGLVDRPNERKQHRGNIPLIGGISVFIGLLSGACVAGQTDVFTCSLLGTAALLVLTGAMDDRFELSVRVRLVVQASAVLTVMLFTGVYIHTLGHLFGVQLELGVLGIPITVVAVIGLLNAFNMMDGIDGLAGMLALVAVGAIASLHGFSQVSGLGVLLLLSAALLPYLAVNLGLVGRKVFLGDAGSVVLGYLLAWTLIRLSQQPDPRLSTVDVLWCVALPVLDTLAVMLRRMSERRSPFQADRGHIHHLLLDAGLGPRASLAVLVALAVTLACLGTLTRRLTPGSNLLSFAVLAVIYIATHGAVWRYQHAQRVGRRTSPLALWLRTARLLVSSRLPAGRAGRAGLHDPIATSETARATRPRKLLP